MEKKPVCVILIAHNKEGKVLAVSRKGNYTDMGLPGGKVEEDETPLEALQRETWEETGLALMNIKEVLADKNLEELGYPIKAFTASAIGVISTKEDAVVRWVDWQEVLNGSFGEFNIKLKQALDELGGQLGG